MRLSRVNSSFVERAIRFIKVLVRGSGDVQSSMQTAPHGVDSNPVKGMIAIQGQTAVRGKTVILGYIHPDLMNKSEKGEMHLYSTDENGSEVLRIKLKNDGTAEFGGTSDNLMRYSPVNQALSNQVQAINAELTKIASGIASAGGAYTPTPITIDISGAKIDEFTSL